MRHDSEGILIHRLREESSADLPNFQLCYWTVDPDTVRRGCQRAFRLATARLRNQYLCTDSRPDEDKTPHRYLHHQKPR